MNLSMPAQVVKDLAERGKLGAVKLVDTFAGDRPGAVPAQGWDNHRWIRYRTATAGLGDLLHDARENWGHYADLLEREKPPSYPVDEGREVDDRAATASLLATAERIRELGYPAHT